MITPSLWSPSSRDVNLLIWSVLENKIHTTSHQNIGSRKTAIEEE